MYQIILFKKRIVKLFLIFWYTKTLFVQVWFILIGKHKSKCHFILFSNLVNFITMVNTLRTETIISLNCICSIQIIRNEKVCKKSANQDLGMLNVHSHFGIKYAIQENLVPICDLKGHILSNKCFTCIVYSLMFMISFEFHTQNGNLKITSYSLQEMSTLFRKMSANQVRSVQGFSHVCKSCIFHLSI